MRLAKILLALAVAAAGLRLMVSNSGVPIQGPEPSPPVSIRSLEDALRGNAVSPYRWVELAEGYLREGDSVKAGLCFHRAEELGPNLPPVWIRAATFHFQLGEREEGLRAGARAQAISDTADAFLFQYYDRFVRDASLVVAALGPDRRALAAYLRHLLTEGKTDDAALAWEEWKRRGFGDRDLGVAYVEFLLRQRRYEAAEWVWAAEAPAGETGGYPEVNRVYNGGFERNPSGCRLDWRITPSEAVEVDRDASVVKEGKSSLRLHFRGTENVSFRSVAQTIVVQPGDYRFSAWLKTDGITTDEGVRFCLSDGESPERLRKQTEPARGTNGWFEIRQDVAVPPQTHLIDVAVCRLPSLKFDSKISGTAWIDAVSVTRIK